MKRNAPIGQRSRLPALQAGNASSTLAGSTNGSEPEPEPENVIAVVTPEAISVSWRPDCWPRESGVAEATRVPGGYWYINRVLVEPLGRRGQGIGSRLLQILLTEMQRLGPGEAVVRPGGYDMKTARQMKFYRKNGFTNVPGEKGRLHRTWEGVGS